MLVPNRNHSFIHSRRNKETENLPYEICNIYTKMKWKRFFPYLSRILYSLSIYTHIHHWMWDTPIDSFSKCEKLKEHLSMFFNINIHIFILFQCFTYLSFSMLCYEAALQLFNFVFVFFFSYCVFLLQLFHIYSSSSSYFFSSICKRVS